MSLPRQLQEILDLRLVRITALALLLIIIGSASFTVVHSVWDPDVWWHLKVGDWIREHHAVPHNGIFSRTAANHPWAAYSWGYEVQLSLFYSMFGLLGIGLNGLVLTMLVGASMLWSSYRLSQRFWLSMVLTSLGCESFLFSLLPRPVFFSMALFAVMMTLLLECRREGKIDKLYFLPLLFLLWANIHIQFVYGLFVLGLFAAAITLRAIVPNLFRRWSCLVEPPLLPLGKLWGILAACTLVACIGPYGPGLYVVIFEYSHAKVTYGFVQELAAIPFDASNSYAEVFMVALGFYFLGWRKKIDLFFLSLMIVATASAFRTVRDAWFVCMIVIFLVAEILRDEKQKEPLLAPKEILPTLGVVVVGLFLMAQNADFSARGLDSEAAKLYPIKASNFVRANSIPGPIFNSFDWGGFLTWYMPAYPVSIDGRNDLYGDELDRRLIEVENGELPCDKDSDCTASNLFVLRNGSSLAKLLSVDPNFAMAYQDAIATVFVRRHSIPGAMPGW